MEELVLVHGQGTPTWTLTLNVPAKGNVIDDLLQDALLKCIREAARDDAIRSMIITGAGSVFSAGADFDLIHRMHSDTVLRENTFELSREIYRELLDIDVPVVAAVNGPAIGAGCTLALLCDVMVMSQSATLGDPRIRLDLVSGDGGVILWPLLSGLPAARLHLLLGDTIDSAEAFRIGLASRVVDADALSAAVASIAERLAAMPRNAVRETKRILNASIASANSDAFNRALIAERDSFDTQEHLDAVAEYEELIRRRKSK